MMLFTGTLEGYGSVGVNTISSAARCGGGGWAVLAAQSAGLWADNGKKCLR
jgi:hypothetical protein